MKFRALLAALLVLLAVARVDAADVILPPDWVQVAARGVDAAVSPEGERWYVGADGRAYRWNETQKEWVRHGDRNDLARVDASTEGAAAISRTGELYITGRDARDNWRPTGMRAVDVGIGGGRIWLADAVLPGGGRGVLTAAFDPSGAAMQWRELPGRLVRIDVDPQGRAWGLDQDGRLYVHDGQAWIEDTQAPPGSDVGVGVRGEILVVAKQADAALGGGTLHLRDPANGNWSQVPGRLSAVSVDRDGRPFGTNSLSWVVASMSVPTLADNVAKPDAPSAGDTTIGGLAGAYLRTTLPQGIADAPVKVVSGNPGLPTAVVVGAARLNGQDAIVVRYAPRANGIYTLLIGHRSLALGDYITGLQGTAAAALNLTRPVFAFVPTLNAVAKPTAAQAQGLAAALGRSDLAGFAPAAGISVLATLDLSGTAAGPAMGQALGFNAADLALTAQSLDQAMFTDVAASETVPKAEGITTIADLGTRYGSTFAKGLEFRAAATALDNKRFGPALLKSPVWSLTVARAGTNALGVDLPPGSQGAVASLALEATLALDLRVPDPDTLPTGPPAGGPPPAPKTTAETLELKGVRIGLDFLDRAVTLDAKVARAASASLASLKGFKLGDADLAGRVKLAQSPGIPEAVDLKITGKGELPSRASGSTSVDLEVDLALDDAKTRLVPTAIATGNLTLADLVGNVAPGISRVKLTRVEISSDYVAGTMTLYGLPVRAVRYQSAGMADPVVAIQHRELDLISYIPKIRDTPLGSFGLANTTLLILGDRAKVPVTYSNRASMPKQLAALIDPKLIPDEQVFPLVLQRGVNLIGQYGARKSDDGDGGNAANVTADSGRDDAGRFVKASFRPGMANNARYMKSSTSGFDNRGGGQRSGGNQYAQNAPDAGAKSVDDNAVNARKVMAAFGIEDGSYVVRARYPASAMKNAPYAESASSGSDNGGGGQQNGSGGQQSGGSGQQNGAKTGQSSGSGRSVSARDVACGINSAVDRLQAADLDPIGGLDLSFALPNFKPPYAGGAIAFSNSRFTLKEIDGQLEPAIVTSMSIKLAQDAAGIRDIGLAAKIRVKGDLNVLCNGVKPDSNVEVSFAGSTALNLASVANVAFDALAKVTEIKPADPKLICEAPAKPSTAAAPNSAVDAASANASMGWKNAFGLPFLEIRKFASSGTFTQKDGKRSIAGASWTESVVGSQTLDVLGSVTLEAEPGASEFKVADWLWRVPGPVQFTGLPGVTALANANTFLELGDLSVCNLDLTPNAMSGTLASQIKNFTGNVVFLRPPASAGAGLGEFEAYVAVNRFSPNMILKQPYQLGGTMGSVVLGRTLFALRNGATTSVKVADLPAAVAQLYTDTVGDLVGQESTIPMVRGISIAGRVTPKEIPDQGATQGLRGFVDLLGVSDPVPVFGGVEVAAGQPGGRGFLDMLIPSMQVPGLSDGGLQLANSRIGLSTLDGKSVNVDTDVRYTPPASASAMVGSVLNMKGTLNYVRGAQSDMDLTVKATSDVALTPTFSVPDLRFGNVGVEVAASRRGTQTTRTVTLVSDASFRGIDAQARLGLTSDGSGQGGTLLELVAPQEGAQLDLNALLGSLTLLPKDYSLVNVSNFVSLKAHGILLAREAGSGRVTLAAEDATGMLNGQTFTGQIAIAGITGTSPVLFLRSDQPLTPGRVFPAAVPLGPFRSLTLPEGVVLLSPSKADMDLSELHPRIYDKVFAKLLGAQDAAEIVADNGLTVLTRLNLPQDLPPGMDAIAKWLPTSGSLIVAGSVDNSGGSPSLGFYADVDGLSLPIPPPMNTFITSAGGHVQVYFKTAGAAGAGAEAGIVSAVKLNAPRLDTLAMQSVDAELKVFVSLNPGAGGTSVSFGARVPGTWIDPMGLEGFMLTDTAVDVGVTSTGTAVSIHTERAVFRDSTGQVRSFLLDLDSAWAGGVPTQLAVQFAKSPDTAQLVIGPIVQAELVNSIFKLAMKSGSKLTASVQKALADNHVPASQLDAFNTFAGTMGGSANKAIELMRASPLAMIGIRNPTVYFATPGNSLPARAGVDAPPLGLGLLVSGQLILDTSAGQIDIADGVYKVNLIDGYFVKGSVTPPSPFNATRFELSGSQPLISILSAPSITLNGNLALPGSTLIPGVSASISGSFEVKRPVALASGVDVTGRVSIAGATTRDASFTVRPGSFDVQSSPSGCVDVPVRLSGNVTVSSLDTAQILGIASPVPPNLLNCATIALGDAAKVALVTAQFTGNLALDGVTQDPLTTAKQVYQAGTQAVALAEGGVQKANAAARDAANLVVNPSAAYLQAKAAFDAAAQVAQRAAEDLLNLGCTVLSSMPFDNWCRQRERQRRAAKVAADQDAWNKALALSDLQRAANANAANSMRDAELKRRDAETALAGVRAADLGAAQSLMNAVAQVRSPATCAEGQFWAPGTRICWTGGLALLAYTGDGNVRCLIQSPGGGESPGLLDNCSFFVPGYTAAMKGLKWRITPDGQVVGETPSYSMTFNRDIDVCLTNAMGQRGQEVTDAGLGLYYCGGTMPEGMKLRYTERGEILTPAGNCLLPVGNKARFSTPVSAHKCDDQAYPLLPGRLRWTPVIPVDNRPTFGLPPTAKLRVASNPALCVGVNGGYLDEYSLQNCSDQPGNTQYMTFGFEDATGFMIASRTSMLCISSGSALGDTSGVVNEACTSTPQQLFELTGSPNAAAGFRNRKSGQCLAIEGTATVGARIVEAPCAAGSAAQGFTLVAAPGHDNLKLPSPPMNSAVAGKLALDNARASVVYHYTSVESLAYPGRVIGRDGRLTAGASNLYVMPGRVGGRTNVTFWWPDGVGTLNDVLTYADRAKILRQSNSTLRADANAVNDVALDMDASFEMVTGLSGTGAFSFRSVNYPNLFLAAQADGSIILAEPPANDAAFLQRATFRLTPLPQ